MPTPITQSREQLIDDVIKVLAKDDRVIFAYLYGSIVSEGKGMISTLPCFRKARQIPIHWLWI